MAGADPEGEVREFDKGFRVLNLGSSGFSVRVVLDHSRAVTNQAVPHEIGARRPGDFTKLVSGSPRAIKELGWQPKRSTLEQMSADPWQGQKSGPYDP